MIEDGLVNAIKASLPSIGGRIYFRRMPQVAPKFPLVVWQRVASPSVYTHDGTRFIEGSWQFVVWSREEDGVECANTADALQAVLDGYSDLKLSHVFLENRFDRFEQSTGLQSVIVEISSMAKE